MKFKVGDKVIKRGGSYEATGTIVAAFLNLAGEERVVFEFSAHYGMLHIFSPSQLELIVPI